MSDLRVIGIGTPTLDRLVAVPERPDFGSGMLVQNLGVEGGGPVATALVAVRRLGLDAALATRLGDDETGAQITAGLAAEGVDLRFVETSEETRSASSVILVDPAADRAILYDPGLATEPALTGALRDAIAAADGLLLDRCTEVTLAAAVHARANGTVVLLDAGGYDERVMELVPHCTVVIGSAYHADARGCSPEAAVDELLDGGAEVGVITLGAQGSVGRRRDGDLISVPTMPVDAVDTTGAGDVYHGAFLAAWLWERDLEHAMRFATVVAGLKCTKPGGRAGIPSQAEADAALAQWIGEQS